jgi:hypothetical protein
MAFCHPGAARLRPVLPVLAHELSQCLVALPGVEVELKELGVTVHARRADPSAVAVIVAQAEALRRTSAGDFRVWPSESTVDVFPDVEWRRGSSALWILVHWAHEGRGQPAVVYLGHDHTDEDAYRVLRAARIWDPRGTAHRRERGIVLGRGPGGGVRPPGTDRVRLERPSCRRVMRAREEVAGHVAEHLFRHDHSRAGWLGDIGLLYPWYRRHAGQVLEQLDRTLVQIDWCDADRPRADSCL